MIPHQYRTVAFTDVPFPLRARALREHFRSRQVYRRTRFVIARHGGQCCIVELTTTDETTLFRDVLDARVLAGPEQTLFVERPGVDTAVPSQLARVADELRAAGHQQSAVVVRGRYEHVNFVLDAQVRQVHVLDVAPPEPAKLVDQVDRLLDVAEELPPTRCVPQVVDLAALASRRPADHYLLPCRGGGLSVGGSDVSYLDEVPDAAPGWVLLGCARSRAIHDHFYPELADGLTQIDICPAALARRTPLPAGAARLTKCCLLEEHIETRGDTVVVPWGASFSLVAQGLAQASELAATRAAEHQAAEQQAAEQQAAEHQAGERVS